MFQAEAKKLQSAKWLAQGTIYPDVVESGGTKGKKAIIKSKWVRLKSALTRILIGWHHGLRRVPRPAYRF